MLDQGNGGQEGLVGKGEGYMRNGDQSLMLESLHIIPVSLFFNNIVLQ